MWTDDSDPMLPALEEWVDLDLEVILDSGACDHVMDAEDAPGYAVTESAGSRRGQVFIVGDGHKIPNEGQVKLNMETLGTEGKAVPVQTTFQVAEIKQPLMSVGKICDHGYSCVFTRDGAQVLDDKQRRVCEFKRQNGMYVGHMKLKPPEPFQRPAP